MTVPVRNWMKVVCGQQFLAWSLWFFNWGIKRWSTGPPAEWISSCSSGTGKKLLCAWPALPFYILLKKIWFWLCIQYKVFLLREVIVAVLMWFLFFFFFLHEHPHFQDMLQGPSSAQWVLVAWNQHVKSLSQYKQINVGKQALIQKVLKKNH